MLPPASSVMLLACTLVAVPPVASTIDPPVDVRLTSPWLEVTVPTFRSPVAVIATVTAVEVPASTSSCCVAATPLRLYVLACGVVVVWPAAWDAPSSISQVDRLPGEGGSGDDQRIGRLVECRHIEVDIPLRGRRLQGRRPVARLDDLDVQRIGARAETAAGAR